MPMHDWTSVSAGTFHAFHNAWIVYLQESLNAGLLPPAYYAQGEQRSGDISPDLLTLQVSDDEGADDNPFSVGRDDDGLVAVAESPPQVRLAQEAAADLAFYLARRKTLVIRHASDDRIVALIEIVSRSNKHGLATLDDFIDKLIAALRDGIHVLVIDPFPTTRHDANGIHGLVWERLLEEPYVAPEDLPLTLVAYCAKQPLTAYVEPIRVGSPLTSMPLFLTRTHYVPVPLEATYQRAFAGVPLRWRTVIEKASAGET